MNKLTVLTVVAVLLLANAKPGFQLPRFCWTRWYNRYNPGTGDDDGLNVLRRENPGQICPEPWLIEAVTVDGNIPAENTGQIFQAYNVEEGFICRNEDQEFGPCYDYKVRFGCPCIPE